VRAALERAGFVFRRQSGSHMILRRDEPHGHVRSGRFSERLLHRRLQKFRDCVF
jgi:predicted RNA binding protein YcfA (HicA-like mRNA interferase family)